MSVIGAEIKALVSRHFLEPDEYVRLYVFDKVTQVDRTIGVGKSGCHCYFSGHLLTPKASHFKQSVIVARGGKDGWD
jgi:hypothetical protein